MRLLILGGTGFLGRNLVSYYLNIKNAEVAVFSRDEAKHWELKGRYPKVHSYVGDVVNSDDLNKCFSEFQPTHVIIAAAMKNIVIVEDNILKGVETNIIGLSNILKVCDKTDSIKKVVFVSTDKASSPKNVYGMTKRICERMAIKWSSKHYKINVVRYGNVLGSTGSIIPILNSQKRPYKLTHPDMTRFLMTAEQAVDLINFAFGEFNRQIFVPVLQSMKIKDLVELWSEKYGIPIEVSGVREGEKIHEELVSPDEIPYIEWTDNNKYITIKQTLSNTLLDHACFISNHNVVTKESLKKLLIGLYFL